MSSSSPAATSPAVASPARAPASSIPEDAKYAAPSASSATETAPVTTATSSPPSSTTASPAAASAAVSSGPAPGAPPSGDDGEDGPVAITPARREAMRQEMRSIAEKIRTYDPKKHGYDSDDDSGVEESDPNEAHTDHDDHDDEDDDEDAEHEHHDAAAPDSADGAAKPAAAAAASETTTTTTTTTAAAAAAPTAGAAADAEIRRRARQHAAASGKAAAPAEAGVELQPTAPATTVVVTKPEQTAAAAEADAASAAPAASTDAAADATSGTTSTVAPVVLSPQQIQQQQQLQQQRTRKSLFRRRKVKIPRHLKTKHRKISREHPEFELTYDMMLGIRTTVSVVEARVHRKLTSRDFKAEVKLRFPGNGSTHTPAHAARDFKFKDYCPDVFRHIRARFDVDPAEYLLCVCGNFEYLEFISNSKSGQFFFYSHDRKYMIKTVTQSESKFLRKILPAYYEHIMKYPNTLLTRFFGMHRVKPHKKREQHFLIMGSVFYTQRAMDTVYDLKGSRQGRDATEDEKRSKSGCVYKDNDFVAKKEMIQLGPTMAKILTDQIAADVSFLERLDIMDYSLLLGIHSTVIRQGVAVPLAPAASGEASISVAPLAAAAAAAAAANAAAPGLAGGAHAAGGVPTASTANGRFNSAPLSRTRSASSRKSSSVLNTPRSQASPLPGTPGSSLSAAGAPSFGAGAAGLGVPTVSAVAEATEDEEAAAEARVAAAIAEAAAATVAGVAASRRPSAAQPLHAAGSPMPASSTLESHLEEDEAVVGGRGRGKSLRPPFSAGAGVSEAGTGSGSVRGSESTAPGAGSGEREESDDDNDDGAGVGSGSAGDAAFDSGEITADAVARQFIEVMIDGETYWYLHGVYYDADGNIAAYDDADGEGDEDEEDGFFIDDDDVDAHAVYSHDEIAEIAAATDLPIDGTAALTSNSNPTSGSGAAAAVAGAGASASGRDGIREGEPLVEVAPDVLADEQTETKDDVATAAGRTSGGGPAAVSVTVGSASPEKSVPASPAVRFHRRPSAMPGSSAPGTLTPGCGTPAAFAPLRRQQSFSNDTAGAAAAAAAAGAAGGATGDEEDDPLHPMRVAPALLLNSPPRQRGATIDSTPPPAAVAAATAAAAAAMAGGTLVVPTSARGINRSRSPGVSPRGRAGAEKAAAERAGLAGTTSLQHSNSASGPGSASNSFGSGSGGVVIPVAGAATGSNQPPAALLLSSPSGRARSLGPGALAHVGPGGASGSGGMTSGGALVGTSHGKEPRVISHAERARLLMRGSSFNRHRAAAIAASASTAGTPNSAGGVKASRRSVVVHVAPRAGDDGAIGLRSRTTGAGASGGTPGSTTAPAGAFRSSLTFLPSRGPATAAASTTTPSAAAATAAAASTGSDGSAAVAAGEAATETVTVAGDAPVSGRAAAISDPQRTTATATSATSPRPVSTSVTTSAAPTAAPTPVAAGTVAKTSSASSSSGGGHYGVPGKYDTTIKPVPVIAGQFAATAAPTADELQRIVPSSGGAGASGSLRRALTPALMATGPGSVASPAAAAGGADAGGLAHLALPDGGSMGTGRRSASPAAVGSAGGSAATSADPSPVAATATASAAATASSSSSASASAAPPAATGASSATTLAAPVTVTVSATAEACVGADQSGDFGAPPDFSRSETVISVTTAPQSPAAGAGGNMRKSAAAAASSATPGPSSTTTATAAATGTAAGARVSASAAASPAATTAPVIATPVPVHRTAPESVVHATPSTAGDTRVVGAAAPTPLPGGVGSDAVSAGVTASLAGSLVSTSASVSTARPGLPFEPAYSVFMQDDGGIRGRDANENPTDTVYYLGIIDILTLYNWRKRGESFFKSFKYSKDDISAVSPKRYAKRFIEYMRNGTA